MILIDRDALEKAIYEWMPKNQEEWTDSTIPPIENLIVSIMMTIQEQPTVDAVPVSFIQQRIDELAELAEYEFESSGGYTGKAHTQMYELRRLINYWKAERNKHD